MQRIEIGLGPAQGLPQGDKLGISVPDIPGHPGDLICHIPRLRRYGVAAARRGGGIVGRWRWARFRHLVSGLRGAGRTGA